MTRMGVRFIVFLVLAASCGCHAARRSGPLAAMADSVFQHQPPDSCLTMSGSGYTFEPRPTPPIQACVQSRGDTIFDLGTDARGLVVTLGYMVRTLSPATRDSSYRAQSQRLTELFGAATPCPQSDDLGITEDQYWPTPAGHTRLAKYGSTNLHIRYELGPGYCHGGA